MIYEDPEPIPQTQVPIGLEPVADFGANLSEAIRFYKDQREISRRVIVVISKQGNYSVWTKPSRERPEYS